MEETNIKMMDEQEDKISELIEGKCYFNKNILKKILNILSNDEYNYSDITYLDNNSNVLYLNVNNTKLNQKNVLMIEKENQDQSKDFQKVSVIFQGDFYQKGGYQRYVKEDKSNLPEILFQFHIEEDLVVKEYSEQSFLKIFILNKDCLSQKIYDSKDILNEQTNLEFVKFFSEIAAQQMIDFGHVLPKCINLIEFILTIRYQSNINPCYSSRTEGCILSSIALGLQQCPNLQIINLILQMIPSYTEECNRFIELTSQIQSLRQYILKLSSCNLSLGDMKKVGQYLGNLKNINFLTIHFWTNQVSHQGVENIYSEIPNCKSLKNLVIDLEQNIISCEGAIILGQILEKCQSLQKLKLDLWSNSIKDKGIISLTSSLSKLKQLRHLQFLIWNNKINVNGLLIALQNIQLIPLYQLDLVIKENDLEKHQLQLIQEKIQTFSHLIWMQLDTEQGIDKMNQAAKKNKRLVQFVSLNGVKYI